MGEGVWVEVVGGGVRVVLCCVRVCGVWWLGSACRWWWGVGVVWCVARGTLSKFLVA